MYNRYYPYLYNRSEQPLPPQPQPSHTPPPAPPPVPPSKPSKPSKPPKPPKKKFDFKCLKKDACTSLNDVECFLNRFSHTLKYIKLIKLLK